MDNISAVRCIKQKGGTHSIQLSNLALEVWEWCLQRQLTIQAEYLPGSLNLVVDSESRTMRLHEKSINFPANSTVSRTFTNRSFCISPDKTATTLLQLEARSRSRSDRCLYPELGPSKGVCKPSVVSDFSVSEPDKTTTGQSTVSDTTLAISTLVSNHPQDIGGLPSSTYPNPGHNPEPHKSGVHNEARGPNTGHMACLRESFAS